MFFYSNEDFRKIVSVTRSLNGFLISIFLVMMIFMSCQLDNSEYDNSEYFSYISKLPNLSSFSDNYLSNGDTFIVETHYGKLDEGETWTYGSNVDLVDHKDFTINVSSGSGDEIRSINVWKFKVKSSGTFTLTLSVFRKPNYLTSSYKLIVN